MQLQTAPTLFDRFFGDLDASRPRATGWAPRLDLVENADGYEVSVDLPGVSEKDVEVEFADGVLQIRGERAAPERADGDRVYRRERVHGKFARSVAFRDEIDVTGIHASFESGVLRVRVPKSEKHQPRRIPLN